MNLGPVVVNLMGTHVDTAERAMLRHPNVGGVILFTRNYDHRAQLGDLCDEIRDVAGRPLLVCVDQEGGRVQRFRDGFSRLPPPGVFGTMYDADPAGALSHARDAALTMAAELRAAGVDLSFMPLADLDLGISGVIGNRAFHSDPAVVAALCRAWCQGMHEAGMARVAKHFPGHGGVPGDSHLEIPVDERCLDELTARDLVPFAALIDDGVEGVMTAHVRYPAVDEVSPTFSSKWIDDVLRTSLGFTGIVFSDDLTMAGASVAGSVPERAAAALAAGCDGLLVCNDPVLTRETVESLEIRAPARPLEMLLGRPGEVGREELEQRVAAFAPILAKLAA